MQETGCDPVSKVLGTGSSGNTVKRLMLLFMWINVRIVEAYFLNLSSVLHQ